MRLIADADRIAVLPAADPRLVLLPGKNSVALSQNRSRYDGTDGLNAFTGGTGDDDVYILHVISLLLA